jgi:hypothetical protein
MKKIKFFKPNFYIRENLAIVGSSMSILKNELGKSIDKFEEIIRFNKSKVEGFEKFVGSKTTIRVVNNPVFECHQSWDNNDPSDKNFVRFLKNIKIIVISPYKISGKIKKDVCLTTNQYFFLEKKIFKIICTIYFIKKIDIFINLLKILFNKKSFSVGFYTILLCIISGIKPTLFGFDFDENMNDRSHYWEIPGKVGNRHDLTLEQNILKKLLKYNMIMVKN